MSVISSNFNYSAAFQPQGQWVLPANAATTPTHSNWANVGSSDQNAADLTGNAIMNSNGVMICPYTGRFDISAIICGSDFSFQGTMTVTMIYTPVNTASQSPKYTMASCTITPTTNQATMEQRVFANAGDMITLLFSPTTPINTAVVSSPATNLLFTDVSVTQDQTFFYSVAGTPPTFASLNKTCLMQTAKVVNGVATFNLCQDGTTTGQSLFQQIISVQAIAQAPATITSSLGVACLSVNPIATNMKTVTVNISVNGGLPSAGWTCFAEIKGY